MSEPGPKAPVVPMDGAGLPLADRSRRAKRVSERGGSTGFVYEEDGLATGGRF
jgi:hypothetical protein